MAKILKRLSGESDLKVTLFASLPFLVGFLVQQVNGWHSDRTGERRWHPAIPLLLSGIALLLALIYGSETAPSDSGISGVRACFFANPRAVLQLPSLLPAYSQAPTVLVLI